MDPRYGGGIMGYSVPTDGTATCHECGEKYPSWRREPMNPCQRCGSYAVTWSPEILPPESNDSMARKWVTDQYRAKAVE